MNVYDCQCVILSMIINRCLSSQFNWSINWHSVAFDLNFALNFIKLNIYFRFDLWFNIDFEFYRIKFFRFDFWFNIDFEFYRVKYFRFVILLHTFNMLTNHWFNNRIQFYRVQCFVFVILLHLLSVLTQWFFIVIENWFTSSSLKLFI